MGFSADFGDSSRGPPANDDVGVIAGVCRVRNGFQNLNQVCVAAHDVQFSGTCEFLAKCDRVGVNAPFEHRLDRFEDQAMPFGEEVLTSEDFGDVVKGFVRQAD